MTSAQEEGKLTFYRQTANGSRIRIIGMAVSALGPSGSPDGAIGSTPEKWPFIPAQTAPNKVLRVNERLVVTFRPAATDTLDASDCRFVIPITYQDKSEDVLGDPDDSTDWDVQQAGDNLYTVGVEADLCAKKVLQPFALGSNTQKAFASVEDDTA